MSGDEKNNGRRHYTEVDLKKAQKEGYQEATIENFGADIAEIKQCLTRIEKKQDNQNDRLTCLETQRRTVGTMTKLAAWLGAALGGVMAMLEALVRLK